jgi:hypothetical protein
MTYAQGFFHLENCPRVQSFYAPCFCDTLKLQAKAQEVPAPVKVLTAAEEA